MTANNTIHRAFIPELGEARHGKVRDIYEKQDQLIMISSDRISCYDRILSEDIPYKGQILNGISKFWFDNTRDIVPNHVVSYPDPNTLVAKKCKALPVEVIVRAYICGSLWRAYEKGARTVSGIALPEGLKENQQLPEPIITPTTKAEEGHDEPISREEIIAQGLVEAPVWNEIERVALQLFKRGQELAAKQGLILIDTKYEFGLDTQGDLVLIDEVHTPDSSRYWFASEQAQKVVRFPDKEFVRLWLKNQGFTGEGPLPHLPETVVQEAYQGYQSVFETLVGSNFNPDPTPPKQRMVQKLKESGLIKGCYTLIVAGSERDDAHVGKIRAALDEEGIPNGAVVASAHKQTQKCVDLMHQFNESLEPVVVIAVAGRSNALGGVLAANMRWPVISCPPLDIHSYPVDIHSSLRMPRQTPALTVLEPCNAALAASKILRIHEV